MSNAKRLKSYKNVDDLKSKVNILTARYVHDLGRKPKQYELDQLEQLALLRITFEIIVDKMGKGYDPKRELVSLVNQYNLLAEKFFGEKGIKERDKKDKANSAWD